jgi:hypothetical protein
MKGDKHQQLKEKTKTKKTQNKNRRKKPNPRASQFSAKCKLHPFLGLAYPGRLSWVWVG